MCFSIRVNKTGLHCVILLICLKILFTHICGHGYVFLYVRIGLWGASHCFVLPCNVFPCLSNDFL